MMIFGQNSKFHILRKMFCALMCAAVLLCTVPVTQVKAAGEAFYARAEILKIKDNMEADASMNIYSTVQGACSDGKYAYFAVQNGTTTILKYDMSTWRLADKVVGISGLDHANDMAYNPDEKTICIAHNAPNYDTVTVLDAQTLEVKSTVKLTVKIYSITYNQKRGIYVVGLSNKYDFATLGKDFNVIDEFEGVSTGYTRQGCDCDDNYIYFSQSGADNLIVVYDYKGNHIVNIPLGSSLEVENIIHSGNAFYTTLHHYGNYLYRVGLSDSSMITYKVNYKANDAYGEMKSTTVHYGKDTKLSANTFSKPGYFFGGWKVFREYDDTYLGYRKGSSEKEWLAPSNVETYELFSDGGTVSKTTKIGNITLTPFWISERYDVYVTAEDAEGYIEPFTVKFGEGFDLPENVFYRHGYVFSHYTAYRDYDGKTYGYRKNAETPEWLYPDELDKAYRFKEGESLSRLTYDGSVYFSAEFASAFVLSDDGAILEEYNGVDESVSIPDSGDIRVISSGCISEKENVSEILIPASVDTLDAGAVLDCPNLTQICFEESFADFTAGNAIIGCGTPETYLIKNGEKIFLGWFVDAGTAAIMKSLSDEFNK